MRSGLRTWHYVPAGLICHLFWPGFAWRVNLRHRAPPVNPAPPLWQSRLAQLVQAGLYVLMIGLPPGRVDCYSAPRGQPGPFSGCNYPR